MKEKAIKKPPHKSNSSWGGKGSSDRNQATASGISSLLVESALSGRSSVVHSSVFCSSKFSGGPSSSKSHLSAIFDPIIFSKVQPVCIFRSMDYLNPPVPWLYQRLCLCCLLKKIVETFSLLLAMVNPPAIVGHSQQTSLHKV